MLAASTTSYIMSVKRAHANIADTSTTLLSGDATDRLEEGEHPDEEQEAVHQVQEEALRNGRLLPPGT